MRYKCEKCEKCEKNKNDIKLFLYLISIYMVNYVCTICLKDFSKKDSFIKHTEKKKKPCRVDLQEFAENCKNLQEFAESDIKTDGCKTEKVKEDNDCTYCFKCFSSVYTLNRHLDSNCKVKKQQEEEINKLKAIQMKEIDELKKQLDKQSKEMEQLKSMVKVNKSTKNPKPQTINNNTMTNSNNTNTTNNTNNTNNIVVNNIILPHGSESKVELQKVLEQLANHNDMLTIIPNMAKEIYINTPENKNFRILDLSRNKCEYYNGEKWVIGKTNEKILKVFDSVNNVLTGPFDKENLIKTLKFIDGNKELKEKNKWINFSKGYCLSLWDESDPENIENKKKIINELKHIFYNYKDEILKIDL